MDPNAAQAITVTQFVNIINETLGFAYPSVTIEGEVSSFKVNQGKWVFFDLKDADNTLSCFMTVHQLKLPIEDGMKVRVTGSPKLTKYSKFSLTVRDIQIAGEGQLRRAMELLKKKLDAEGLFDPARKRPLPRFPRRLGLITSGTSAAYADFIKVLGQRFGGLEIMLADITVQGAQAPDQIVRALDYFNQLKEPVDVLVLIRGGGSLEDLMAFSTEPVARAVAASRTPIIVGVGHEVDFSLADYAADVRAATPTDAARIVIPDRAEVYAHVSHLDTRITSYLDGALDDRAMRIDHAITRLEAYLRHPRERVMAIEANLHRHLDRISHLGRTQRTSIDNLAVRLDRSAVRLLSDRHTHIDNLTRLLRGFDPTAVLSRGYAIARDAQGHTIRDATIVPSGSAITIQVSQGRISAKVT